jgi:pilus assembly protein CpaB
MNRNVIILLAGGVLISVLVAALAMASMSGGKKKSAPKIESKLEIVVAAHALKAGTDLKDSDIKWQKWPESGAIPGAIKRKADEAPLDAVKGRLKRPVAEGEPILKSALLGEEKGNLAAVLSPGKRAVTISVNSLTQVGGFAAAGDYVDVILTYRERARIPGQDKDPAIKDTVTKSIQSYASETILQNVKVLAVDQSMKRPAADENVKPGKTVTLEVDQKGAETLVLAAKLGTMTLALRQLGDETVTEKDYPIVTDARITNIYDEVEQEVDRQKAAGENSTNVRIYSGETVQDIPVTK